MGISLDETVKVFVSTPRSRKNAHLQTAPSFGLLLRCRMQNIHNYEQSTVGSMKIVFSERVRYLPELC